VLIGWAAINIIINVTWARWHVTVTTNHRCGLTERGQVATKQVNEKGQNSTPRQSPRQNPLTIFTKIGERDYVVDFTRHAKFCIDRFRGLWSPNKWLWLAFDVKFFLQSVSLNGSLRKIHKRTLFRVRKCFLGVQIFRPKFPSTAILGTDFACSQKLL